MNLDNHLCKTIMPTKLSFWLHLYWLPWYLETLVCLVYSSRHFPELPIAMPDLTNVECTKELVRYSRSDCEFLRLNMLYFHLSSLNGHHFHSFALSDQMQWRLSLLFNTIWLSSLLLKFTRFSFSNQAVPVVRAMKSPGVINSKVFTRP